MYVYIYIYIYVYTCVTMSRCRDGGVARDFEATGGGVSRKTGKTNEMSTIVQKERNLGLNH